jgi:hypothetical protein
MINLFLFVVSVIGMTHIIVDGSIFESVRTYFKKFMAKIKLEHMGSLVDCYLCSGTWCGFFMGYVWITDEPLKVFACGCAGGFIANLGASILNLIEALTIVRLSENE